MIPNIYRYPVDLTGQSNDNYITGEVHAIGTAPVRAIAPTAGSFFGASVDIVDAFTQKPLTQSQYAFQFLHTEATLATGEEVWGVLLITDPSVNPSVSLSYQTLGGPNDQPMTTIAQEIAGLALDNRGVLFRNLTGFPDTVTPVPHMHWVGDTYDWDYIVTALELCLNAMALSESASYDSTLVFIDQQKGLRDQDIAALANALQQHITNYKNPHQVTLAQVDVFSTTQVNALIATEAAARTTADTQVNTDIQTHASNFNNPHFDTADNIGGYSTSETDANLAAVVAAINTILNNDSLEMAQHIANHDNPHQVSLELLDAQSTSQINATIAAGITPISTQFASNLSSMNTHIANENNPHQLSNSQIGSMDSEDIQTLSDSITTHEANTDNPHQTSASQAGTWTTVQIATNIATSFTTPVTTALTSQTTAITAHVSNHSNPHGVTPAQIGGWQYSDWLAVLANERSVLSF